MYTYFNRKLPISEETIKQQLEFELIKRHPDINTSEPLIQEFITMMTYLQVQLNECHNILLAEI